MQCRPGSRMLKVFAQSQATFVLQIKITEEEEGDSKNKTYMFDCLQGTYLKILDEKSANKILPVFLQKICKRVHIEDILLNTVSSATRAMAYLGTRSATCQKLKRYIY